MLIKEYRISLPMSVDEYRIAQLYMIQVRERERERERVLSSGGFWWPNLVRHWKFLSLMYQTNLKINLFRGSLAHPCTLPVTFSSSLSVHLLLICTDAFQIQNEVHSLRFAHIRTSSPLNAKEIHLLLAHFNKLETFSLLIFFINE